MATKNDRVTAFRRLNKLTQEELGDFLGVSKSFVSQIENGRPGSCGQSGFSFR